MQLRFNCHVFGSLADFWVGCKLCDTSQDLQESGISTGIRLIPVRWWTSLFGNLSREMRDEFFRNQQRGKRYRLCFDKLPILNIDVTSIVCSPGGTSQRLMDQNARRIKEQICEIPSLSMRDEGLVWGVSTIEL